MQEAAGGKDDESLLPEAQRKSTSNWILKILFVRKLRKTIPPPPLRQPNVFSAEHHRNKKEMENEAAVSYDFTKFFRQIFKAKPIDYSQGQRVCYSLLD